MSISQSGNQQRARPPPASAQIHLPNALPHCRRHIISNCRLLRLLCLYYNFLKALRSPPARLIANRRPQKPVSSARAPDDSRTRDGNPVRTATGIVIILRRRQTPTALSLPSGVAQVTVPTATGTASSAKHPTTPLRNGKPPAGQWKIRNQYADITHEMRIWCPRPDLNRHGLSA